MTEELRNAAQNALDALEGFLRFMAIMNDGPDASDKLLAEDHAEGAFLKAATAVPALRAALAAPSVPSGPLRTDVPWALSAAPQPAPAGWRLVPVEPTPEMRDAADQLPLVFSVGDEYRAMLDAAPAAPGGAHD